ncbi:MAG: YlxR family protein [Oscillospiraceae bacterium]|nr:YlxR family protein [Oscillospiraceae bacterium]
MMKQRKIPVRQCLGCGEPREKKELIRVVRSPEGELSIDLTGKKSGRGAYICRSVECFNKAKKARRFEKNFQMAIPEEIYLKLEAELKAGEE